MGLIRCENGHLFSEKKYGNVCPYCNTAVNKNSNKEEDPLGKYSDVVYLNDLEILKPVTGWLVCLEGPSKGRDYRIIAEKNFIGRSPEMDIRILGDNNISYKNQSEKSCDYCVRPGKKQNDAFAGRFAGARIYPG